MPTVHYIKAGPLSARANREVGGTLGLPGPPGLERLEKQVLIK